MKKIITLLLTFSLVLSLCSCGYKYSNTNYDGSYSNELAGTTLTVYNWGEYISDGGDDSATLDYPTFAKLASEQSVRVIMKFFE